MKKQTTKQMLNRLEKLQEELFNLRDGQSTIIRRLAIFRETMKLIDLIRLQIYGKSKIGKGQV